MRFSDCFDLQPEAGFRSEMRHYWKPLLIFALISLFVHMILWRVWPLYNAIGTDPKGEVGLYVDAFESQWPSQYWHAAFRGPIPPLFYGSALALEPRLAPIGLTLIAVMSIELVFLIAIPWGYRVALLSSLLYLFDLPLQLVFHQIGTEGFATLFVLVSLLAFRYAMQTPQSLQWSLLGVSIGLSTLSRPNNLASLVVVLGLLVFNLPIGRRVWLCFVTIAFTFLILSPWIIYRGLKYDLWLISRGASYSIFFEAYDDELVQEGNGPATEKLINILNEHLLSQNAYRAANVSLKRVLRADHNPDYQKKVYSVNEYIQDIVYVVDEYDGWNNNYRLLADVGAEAILTHPREFINAMGKGLKAVFLDYDVMSPATPRPLGLPRLPGERSWPPIYSILYSHPNTISLPSVEIMARSRQRTMQLLSPLTTAQGDIILGDTLIRIWKQIWPPLLLVYGLSLIAIISNRGRSLFYLLTSTVYSAGMTALSSLFGNLPRYRMTFESIFVISCAIGATYVLSTLYRITLQDNKILMKPTK